MDLFYSPPEISKKMVGVAAPPRPKYIADFAAGEGELLRAASKRWRKCQFIATDINQHNVNFLKLHEPDWLIGKCDFLNPISRGHCKVLVGLEGQVSLILLNPPFTCRGASKWLVAINEIEVECSLALAFVITSSVYLAPRGQIVAVLPAGSLQNEKDNSAWEVLHRLFSIELVSTNGPNTFSGCSPRTVIVKFTKLAAEKPYRKASRLNQGDAAASDTNKIKVKLIRGWVSMNTLDEVQSTESVPLIHSTGLQATGVNLSQYRADHRLGEIIGPAVLLPRVGKPNKSKILLHRHQISLVLSDCVIALQCETINDAHSVHKMLLENWTKIEHCYIGTCARYITLNALSRILKEFGYGVSSNGSGTPNGIEKQ